MYVTPELHNLINVLKGEASANSCPLVFELTAGCGCTWFYYTSGRQEVTQKKNCIKVPYLPSSDLGALFEALTPRQLPLEESEGLLTCEGSE